MPRLNVKTTEFADIVCCFLLDKMNNSDTVLPLNAGNENFEDFIEVMKHKGLRSVLLTYYMHMDPQTRVRYRLIRDVFNVGGQMPTADIHMEHVDVEVPAVIAKPKRTLLKKIITAGLAIITGAKILNKIRK